MDSLHLCADEALPPARPLEAKPVLESPAKSNGAAPRTSRQAETIELIPGVTLELLFNGSRFLGLGQIEIDGVPVRSSRRPMFVELRTPDGVELFDFHLRHSSQEANSLTLEFTMKARASGLQDWMLHTVRNLRVTRDWAEPEWASDAVLKLHLRGIERTLGGRTFRGFEYHYEFESTENPIYRLLDMSSWALGGSLADSTFWMRNCFAPSLHTFTGSDDFYSTEWYCGGIANPNIFQFQPFQTNMESFTMLSSGQGQLLTIAPKLFHLRSFFEKPRKTEELLHWHEHCGDLSSRFSGAPMQVLFSPQPATKAELINLNEAVRNDVYDGLHRQAGLRRERITTYGVLEEWSLPNLKDYAERILPQFLEMGIRCIFLPNQFQHNLNMWGVSNMCCTVDYKMPSVEAEQQLRAFCDRAHAGGAQVQMWGNTAISSLDFLLRPQQRSGSQHPELFSSKGSVLEIVDKTPQAYIRAPSGAVEADHYAPSFQCLNLREPAIRQYWHQCWQRARTEIGLDGIFLDSSFNLSSDKFHFSYEVQGTGSATCEQPSVSQTRPETGQPRSVLSMYFAHLELMAEMQAYGYHYSGEDVGVFGLKRSGPGIERRLDSLFLWSDSYAAFDQGAIRKAGGSPDDIFFRGLAYRLMWNLYWNFDLQAISFSHTRGTEEDRPTAWHRSLLQAYNRVEGQMLRRDVLENDHGVRYYGPQSEVVWAFSDFEMELQPGQTAQNLVTGETVLNSQMRAQKHGIYEIVKTHDPA